VAQPVKLRVLLEQRFHPGIVMDHRGQDRPAGMMSIEECSYRFFAVIRHHLFLQEAPIGKDSAFHPGIAKIEAEGRSHG
jgi:hypothetical protein